MKLPYSGLADVHNKTGWVYTAHNRMWSSEVTYAKQNGGKYDWIVNEKGALPMSEDFWMWLMSEGVTWGLQMYRFCLRPIVQPVHASETVGFDWE